MTLTELIDFSGATLTLPTILLNFSVSFVAAWIIYIVYRMSYTGVAYSKNFNVSIVLTTMVTAMVMMVIGNNLALSLGMVGALSIVRFRAAVKESRDISFLFWGIAVGLSAGTGAHGIAIIGTLVMTVTIFLFRFNLSGESGSFLLVIKGTQLNAEQITKQVNSITKSHKLRMKNTSTEQTEVVYEVKITKDSEDQVISLLKEIDGIETVNVVAYNGNITG